MIFKNYYNLSTLLDGAQCQLEQCPEQNAKLNRLYLASSRGRVFLLYCQFMKEKSTVRPSQVFWSWWEPMGETSRMLQPGSGLHQTIRKLILLTNQINQTSLYFSFSFANGRETRLLFKYSLCFPPARALVDIVIRLTLCYSWPSQILASQTPKIFLYVARKNGGTLYYSSVLLFFFLKIAEEITQGYLYSSFFARLKSSPVMSERKKHPRQTLQRKTELCPVTVDFCMHIVQIEQIAN